MIQQVATALRHVRSLSGKGDRPEQFQVRLCGIDVAEDGLLAIGDREVKRFNRDGTLEQRFPTRDAGWCVAAVGETIWVGMQGAIDRLDQQGKLVESIDRPGTLGSHHVAGDSGGCDVRRGRHE